MFKQFGGKISNADKKRFSKSENWDGKQFLNLEETTMDIPLKDMPGLLYKQFLKTKNRSPKKELPILHFDDTAFLSDSTTTKCIWYGHSVILLRMNSKTILIDPMFGQNAAPISPFPIKRFSKNTLAIIDELPEIDLILLTHDHYDHLDYKSIKKLLPKVKQFYTALGCARHLVSWGADAQKIQEFDWWETTMFNSITITFTPTRHFSGRGITDRAKSIWGGWVLKSDTENLYFTGDSGYGSHFKEVGDKLGPFDFAFVECGQYNENWHQIHMFPEEGIQASIDFNVTKIMPVHWGAFALAQHNWEEPVERFYKEALRKNIPLYIPKLGELFDIQKTPKQELWWETIK